MPDNTDIFSQIVIKSNYIYLFGNKVLGISSKIGGLNIMFNFKIQQHTA